MGLADTISKKPSDKPTFTTLDQMDDDLPPFESGIVYADYKVGKTTFAASVTHYWASEGYDPKECAMYFLDNEKGRTTILSGDCVHPDFRSRVHYDLAHDWPSMRDKTDALLGAAKDHMRDHGARKTMLVVDNLQNPWQWAQDDYSLNTYGMAMDEMRARARKKAIAAGKKQLPDFDQNDVEWGTVNAKHNSWADSIVLSGVPFMFLTPENSYEERRGPNKGEQVIKPRGQKHNVGRVDHLLRLYREGDERFCDLEGTRRREVKKLFVRMPDPSFGKLVRWLDKQIEDYEKEQNPTKSEGDE